MLPVGSCTLIIRFYFPPWRTFSNVTPAVELWNHKVLDWNHVTCHMEGSYGRNGTVQGMGKKLFYFSQFVNIYNFKARYNAVILCCRGLTSYESRHSERLGLPQSLVASSLQPVSRSRDRFLIGYLIRLTQRHTGTLRCDPSHPLMRRNPPT